jgi:hypothetical protein
MTRNHSKWYGVLVLTDSFASTGTNEQFFGQCLRILVGIAVAKARARRQYQMVNLCEIGPREGNPRSPIKVPTDVVVDRSRATRS